jgi:CubicO group peptidase (beta-lactamase class C family)
VPHAARLRFSSTTLPLAAAALVAAGQAVLAQAPREGRARVVRTIDSLANAFLADGPVAGVSVAVVKGRDTILMKGYGYADIENDVRATPMTVYRIGSITKQFTSAAIMRLVEQGKLALDDTLGKLLPGTSASWSGITLRRLLNHTSGIRSYTSIGPRWQRRWREDMSPDTIVGLVRDDTLDFKPGTQWRYNNTGYVLLGMIIERASGKPYATYLEDEFFRPLGLSQTYYCSQRPIIKHRAQGYDRSGRPDVFGRRDTTTSRSQLVNTEYLSMTQPFSAGALCSTVGDLVAWQRALTSGRVVRPASYAAMTTPETLSDGKPLTYGYGIGVGTFEKRRKVSHGGGINGFITDLSYYPDDSLHVVVLANTSPANPGRLGEQIARVALGLPLLRPPTAVTLSAAERARYAGTYTLKVPSGQTFPVRIFDENGTLMGQVGPQPPVKLVALGNHVFVRAEDPDVRMTFAVSGERATKLMLVDGGQTLEAPRAP